MACSWSPENATKAFISTMKMETRTKEPNSAEFISALAAGNNAQLILTAPSTTTPNATTTSTLLALVAAAQQTGGRVICIIPNTSIQSQLNLCSDAAQRIEFVVGNARDLLNKYQKTADFVVIDCNLERYENVVRGIIKERSAKREKKSVMVLGYNAFCKGSSWQWSGLKTHLLPIGDGLLITKIGGAAAAVGVCSSKDGNNNKRSRWVVKIDECTGEEHVFRVRSPQSPHRKGIVV